jgi:hypothetical protein
MIPTGKAWSAPPKNQLDHWWGVPPQQPLKASEGAMQRAQKKADKARCGSFKRKFPSKNARIFVQCFDFKSEISRFSRFKLH